MKANKRLLESHGPFDCTRNRSSLTNSRSAILLDRSPSIENPVTGTFNPRFDPLFQVGVGDRIQPTVNNAKEKNSLPLSLSSSPSIDSQSRTAVFQHSKGNMFHSKGFTKRTKQGHTKTLILLSSLLTVVFFFHLYFSDSVPAQFPSLLLTTDNEQTLKNENERPVFHIVISAGGDNLSTLNMRSIESIFYHHKKAKLIIHSNQETGLASGIQHPKLQPLLQLGYDIQLKEYLPHKVLRQAMELPGSHMKKDVVQPFADKMEDGSLEKGRFWYANEANMMRLLVLYLQGGIYLDTDVVLINKVLGGSTTLDNAAARHSDKKGFHNSVLKFNQPNNPFLAEVLHNMILNYDGHIWGYNGVRAFGRAAKEHSDLVCPPLPLDIAKELQEMESPPAPTSGNNTNTDCWIHPLPNDSTAAIHWTEWDEYCFQDDSPTYQDTKKLLTNSLLLHFNNKNVGGKIAERLYKKGTVCDYALQNFCITCQD